MTQRVLTDTCARNPQNGYGNNSSWSQRTWLWQCRDCHGGNKLLANPRLRGHFCFAFFWVASLVCLMLWTTEGRPHLSRIRGCVCWCLICYSSTIWTTQWLVRRNSSLMLKSRKSFSTQMSMCWLPSGRPNASRHHPSQKTNKCSHHQLLSVKSSCPSSVNKFTGRVCVPCGIPDQDCAGCAPNPQQETRPRSQTLCRLRLVCGHQCCKSGAILARPACLRTHLKDSVRRGFCRASCAKESPT